MQLRGIDPAHLIFVGAGSPKEARELQRALKSPHRFLCDPGYVLYREFGFGEGSGGQLIGPAVVLGGLRATMKGHLPGAPPTNPKQLGGAVILDRDGYVMWRHESRHAADNIGAVNLKQALDEAKKMRER